jgi:hypothetical protein
LRLGYASALVVAAVLAMVSVAVPAATLVMLTGLVAPKLSVGMFCALAGLPDTAAVSATLPVKPLLGVTVIVDVFPLVAPGSIDTAVPVTVKLGTAVTITVVVPLAAA